MSFKKSFVNVVCALILCAVALTQFVACGDNGANDSNNGNNGGDTPVINEIEIESVLEQNSAYANLDLQTAIEEAILQRVASQFEVTTSNVELLDVQRKNNLTIVAKVSGSKIVTAYCQNNAFAAYEGADKKDLVLQKAGYTAKQKIEQSKKDEANAKITQAVNEVAATIEQLGNADFDKTNVILDGFSDEKYIPESLKSACDFAFLGKVREDGTVIAITLTNGTLKDNVLSVEGKEDLTNEQILTTVASGNGFSTTTRTIDASKTYETPKLIEYVDFDTVFNEIFGKDYSLPSPTELIENALPNIYNFGNVRSVKLIMYSIDSGKFVLCAESVDKLDRAGLRRGIYKGSDYDKISGYANDYQEMSDNFKQYVCEKYMQNKIEVGSAEETSLKENMTSLKTKLDDEIEVFVKLDTDKFSSHRYSIQTDTRDTVDKAAFGKKLCPDKDIIATYVGAMGTRQLDAYTRFNTGYYSAFNMAVVYKENDTIIIRTVKIYVPWYTDSTNQSLYNSFLNGEENKKYKILERGTETVNNPVLAEGIGDNQD